MFRFGSFLVRFWFAYVSFLPNFLSGFKFGTVYKNNKCCTKIICRGPRALSGPLTLIFLKQTVLFLSQYAEDSRRILDFIFCCCLEWDFNILLQCRLKDSCYKFCFQCLVRFRYLFHCPFRWLNENFAEKIKRKFGIPIKIPIVGYHNYLERNFRR